MKASLTVGLWNRDTNSVRDKPPTQKLEERAFQAEGAVSAPHEEPPGQHVLEQEEQEKT